MPRVTLGDLPAWVDLGNGRRRRADEIPCPACGQLLAVDEAAQRVTAHRMRTVRLAFCTGCEFAHEF